MAVLTERLMAPLIRMTTSPMLFNQRDGWMDGAAYQIWVQRVLAPYAAAHNNKIYFLQDMFSIHLHNNSITALNHLGIEVDFIPAGYTQALQLMDKGIHKPFK
jgi:hypothetical protein